MPLAAKCVALPTAKSTTLAKSRSQVVYLPRPIVTQSECDNTQKIEHCSLNELRRRVRQNRVSFPAQVPTFRKHDRPDVQRKAVQLYFLFGWSCNKIAQRLGLLRQRIQQILSTWKRRAIEMGYIQEIPPDPTPVGLCGNTKQLGS
jgi:hypothetical protein